MVNMQFRGGGCQEATGRSGTTRSVIILPLGDENESSTTPYLNYTFIGLNVIVFAYMLALPSDDKQAFVNAWASVPAHFSWLTALTSTFLHAGFAHLFGNMFFLWVYGDNVEDKLGHPGYLVFYLGTGVFSSVCYAHSVPLAYSTIPSLGASGAISAVIGAYAVFFPWAKIKYWCFIWFIVPYQRTVRIWSWVTIGFWFLGQALSQAASMDSGQMDGVAYAAHVGGFLIGCVVALGLKMTGADRDTSPHPAPAQPAVPLIQKREVVVEHPCPACGSELHPMHLPRIDVDECRECGGMWCTWASTETLLQLPQLPGSVLDPPAQHPDRPAFPGGKRACPRCDVALGLQQVQGIELDCCPQCKGVYFDRGEFRRLYRSVHPGTD